MSRQQLLALDPNIYGAEQFRHGLTPPQLGPDQMHPYGKTTDTTQRRDLYQTHDIPELRLIFHTLFTILILPDSETVFHDLDSDGSLGHLGDCLLATAEGGVVAGRVGNPIDRLYSMQNSYFTS